LEFPFLPYSALGGACGYIIGMERGKDKWKIRRASFPNRRWEVRDNEQFKNF